MKRVVTGHNEQGKSVFVEVAEPDHVVEAPGMTWRELWATFPDTKVPLNPDYKAEHKSRWTSIFPAVGSTRVRIVQFDPDSREADDTFMNDEKGCLFLLNPGLRILEINPLLWFTGLFKLQAYNLSLSNVTP